MILPSSLGDSQGPTQSISSFGERPQGLSSNLICITLEVRMVMFRGAFEMVLATFEMGEFSPPPHMPSLDINGEMSGF